MTATLSDFEGLPVTEAGVEIPGAAGGLREAMEVDPVELHKGARVWIVLECAVAKVRHDPVDKAELDGDQRRVHILQVDSAAFVDEGVVRDHLDQQAERIQLAKEQAEGVQRLPTDVELDDAHDRGEHASGLVDGCFACDEEARLVAEEGGEG